MAHILPDREQPGLEERVAALEAAIAFPPRFIQAPELLTTEEEKRLREEFEQSLGQPLRIMPQEPPLTPEQIRHLLRECVTVVKPGEVLILRGRDGWTPEQVGEVHRIAAEWLKENAPGVKALAVPPMEITIMPAGEPEGAPGAA